MRSFLAGCGAAAAREQTLIVAGAGDAVSAPSCRARGMSPRGMKTIACFCVTNRHGALKLVSHEGS